MQVYIFRQNATLRSWTQGAFGHILRSPPCDATLSLVSIEYFLYRREPPALANQQTVQNVKVLDIRMKKTGAFWFLLVSGTIVYIICTLLLSICSSSDATEPYDGGLMMCELNWPRLWRGKCYQNWLCLNWAYRNPKRGQWWKSRSTVQYKINSSPYLRLIPYFYISSFPTFTDCVFSPRHHSTAVFNISQQNLPQLNV